MYIKSALFQLENRDAQARLGSQPSQLGSAQLQKFQLELYILDILSKIIIGNLPYFEFQDLYF